MWWVMLLVPWPILFCGLVGTLAYLKRQEAKKLENESLLAAATAAAAAAKTEEETRLIQETELKRETLAQETVINELEKQRLQEAEHRAALEAKEAERKTAREARKAAKDAANQGMFGLSS